ncbi:MAG: transporter substrate-binding domain-containing protein [Rhodospirillales bacterium]|nr:transporter substrate-binding domain-containing protein [Rhodospirillales bacterium]
MTVSHAPTGRNRRRWFRAAAMLIVAIVMQATSAAAACALRVGWTPYAIYTFTDGDGDVRGIDADLITALAHAVGCTTQFYRLPWARILLEIQSGELDVTSSASRTADRDVFALFSQPYRPAQRAIYVRRSEATKYPLNSLAEVPQSGMRLGIIVGYDYGEEFHRLAGDPAFAAALDGAVGYQVSIQKLLFNRIDGVLVDDAGVMIGELKAMGVADRVERHPLRIASDPLHFMFSRASISPDMVEAINLNLARMKTDGRLQAIFDAYLE